MKTRPLFLLVLVSICSLSAAAQGLVSGQLLKSNGKPLPYTEIELVPVGSKRIVNDARLIGISGSDGRFSMPAVPAGKYTLSINFDDKPTELSPYETYFYPGAYERAEAEIFDVRQGDKFQKLVFKLPPALVRRKIAGRVVFENGEPVAGAYLALRDLKFDRGVFFGTYRTDKLGNFSFNAFADRRYQVAAVLIERLGETPLDPVEFRGAAESAAFVLETLPVNLRLTLREYQSYDQIREKYMGRLAPEYSLEIFDAPTRGE
jgi:hypothetical protein